MCRSPSERSSNSLHGTVHNSWNRVLIKLLIDTPERVGRMSPESVEGRKVV